MNNAAKYIISGIMIMAGIVFLVQGGQFTEGKQSDLSITHPGIVYEHVDPELLNKVIAQPGVVESYDNSPGIVPLMILTTKACPPCLNNVADYANLLKNHSQFLGLTLVFVGEKESAVERFVMISNLKLPYFIINREDANPVFSELEQNLIFVEWNEGVVFYNEPVPNAVIPLVIKEEQLRDIAAIWKSRSDPVNVIGP